MKHANSRGVPGSGERALIEAARRQASALATVGAEDPPTAERSDCPPLETLSDWESGRLGEAEARAIRQHLQACEACAVFVDAGNQVAPAADTVSSDGGATISRTTPTQSPSEPLAAPPRQLGQYEIREVLGRGGMGAVYKARHAKLDKLVALKILPPERLEDPAAVERFEREMRAVGKLAHPNIAAAHDAGECEGTHFLVMELVDGVDLSALTRKLGPLPVAESCELIRQAAVGLQHAHGRGLVHRDIKPSNLLLARSVEDRPLLKVLDFGLALLEEPAAPGAGELTTASQFMGTWDYVAPEQALDTHHVDARADIYSLGATLYKLLTGATPFPREQFNSPLQAMMAKTGASAPPIQTLRELPEGLGPFIDRMLNRSPGDRPATCEEVAQALAPYAAEADLTALLRRFDDAEHLAAPEAASQGIQLRTPDAEATADFQPNVVAAMPQSAGVGSRGRRRVLTLVAMAGLFVLCGVVLIIRDRDGKEKLRVQLESGDGLELADNASEELPAQGPAPKTKAAAAAAANDHERAVANWVLEQGGSVTLRTASGEQAVSSKSGSLPEAPFIVRRIDLSAAVDIKDEDLKRLTVLRNLGVLTLGPSSQLTDAVATHVAQIESLWGLNLVRCPITDQGLKPLARLPNLTQVSLQNVSITAAGMQTLAGFPALAYLDLRNLKLHGAWCEPLKNASNLEDLILDLPQLDEEAWQSLLSCQQLTGLSFNVRACPPPARLQQLSRLPQLTKVVIWEYPNRTTELPTPEQLHAIGQLKQLKKVCLEGVHVTPKGLEALAPLELEELRLYTTRLEGVDLAPLEQHKQLKVLNLEKTGLSAEAVAALGAALPDCTIHADFPPEKASGNSP